MESDFCSEQSKSGETEEFGKGEGDSKLEKLEFDIEPLKTPWVPAPAKTTQTTPPKEHHHYRSSSKRRGRSYERVRRHASSKATSTTRSNDLPYKLKKSKPKEQRNISDFKLRTKGSLIDVSAALNDKREKLVGLWKENLPTNNSLLLIELEKANVLALEASKELDDLQKTIREMQKKSDLTDEDNAILDVMRNDVMLKLDAFESSNTRVEDLKRSLKGRSENHISEIECSISEPDLGISNSSDEEGFGGLPSSISQPDLSKLDEEYENLSPKTSLESNCPQIPPKRLQAEMAESQNQAFLATYYVNKIKSMEEKLVEQDERLSEFRTSIFDLRSHSSYDLSTLKADLKDKFEQLEPLPELLFLTEQRLGESLQARVKLEEQLKQKDEKFSQAIAQLAKFEVEMREMRDKMNAAEVEMKNLNQNMHKLKSYNASLRTELKLRTTRNDNVSQYIPPTEHHQTNSSLILNDKIKDLERDLASAKREAHFFKETKDKLEDQTEKRLEELRGSLEDSRHRNRLYQSQITFIRSSYHNLFPVEIFSPTSGRRTQDKLQSPSTNKAKKGSTDEIQKGN